MQTPGLNHVVLTVADARRSQAFYRDVLGFEVTEMEGFPETEVWMKGSFYFVLGDMGFFFLSSKYPIDGDRFNEFRIGLDHLSFTAPSREFLDEMAEKLKAVGVETKGVEQFVTGNYYIAFRDPDNIQLEYWLP